MTISEFEHYIDVYGERLKTSSRFAKRIGFWADVKAIDVKHGFVDVLSDQGFIVKAIPLASREWVVEHDNYVSSERNFPPVGTRVFVLVPNGDIASAFVLCSGIPLGEKGLQKLWAKNDDETKDKENIHERVTQGGWDFKEDARTGNISIVSVENNISIEINPKDNSDLEQEKILSVKAYGNSFEFTEEGIKITDSSENKIIAGSDGISVEDLNGNKIEFKSGETGKSIVINGNLEVLQ